MIYRLAGVASFYDGGVTFHGIPVDTVAVIDLTAEVPADSARAALREVLSLAATIWSHRYCLAYDVTATDEQGREERLTR